MFHELINSTYLVTATILRVWSKVSLNTYGIAGTTQKVTCYPGLSGPALSSEILPTLDRHHVASQLA